MSSSKRKPGATISPPPVKRKAQSSISKNAVNSFFTPASQKPKDRTAWSERAPDDDTPATLLVGRYEPETKDADSDSSRAKRRKIAAFDLDSTLITTKSGKTHASDPADWKWWDTSVPTRLRSLYHEEGYRVVILSNQGGLTLHPDPNSKAPKMAGKERVAKFKQKCSAVLSQLDIPTTIYAATEKDIYRKPRTGMWREVCEDYDIVEADVDLEASVFVGDAGGRVAVLGRNGEKAVTASAKDFSCSDRNLAHNIGIDYRTPEEFFLGEKPREWTRDFDLQQFPYTEPTTVGAKAEKGEVTDGEDKKREIVFTKKQRQELVLFVGPPGAGKSTFYFRHLAPLGYTRVNQDTLKSRAKCLAVASAALTAGESVAVDNTNPDVDGRAEWIALAAKHGVSGVPVRCVWFRTPLALCEHNDAVRSMNRGMNPEMRAALPKLAFNGFASRFREPRASEGFDDVTVVEFKFKGTKEEYDVWGRYWN